MKLDPLIALHSLLRLKCIVDDISENASKVYVINVGLIPRIARDEHLNSVKIRKL